MIFIAKINFFKIIYSVRQKRHAKLPRMQYTVQSHNNAIFWVHRNGMCCTVSELSNKEAILQRSYRKNDREENDHFMVIFL